MFNSPFLSDIVSSQIAFSPRSERIVDIVLLLPAVKMGKKASLTESQGAQVVILCREGQSERKISEKLGVSKNSSASGDCKVQKIWVVL